MSKTHSKKEHYRLLVHRDGIVLEAHIDLFALGHLVRFLDSLSEEHYQEKLIRKDLKDLEQP